MGNVLSFPILCLINLTGFLVSAEKFVNWVQPQELSDLSLHDKLTWDLLTEFFDYSPDGKRRLKKDRAMFNKLPVRVNGDDILFQASNMFYQVWSDTLKDVGFQKSVGKNYYSEFFFTVNSQIFIPGRAPKPGWTFQDGPHRLNHIWWSGLSPDFLRRRTDFRSLVGRDAATIADSRAFLSAVQADFLESVPSGQRKIWNRLFLRNNQEFIDSFDSYDQPLRSLRKGEDPKRVPRGHFYVSRSLPVKLGGLGLELPEPEVLTYSQKVLAFRLLLSECRSPFTLGESSLINVLLKPYRAYFENRFPVRNVSSLEAARLEETHTVIPLNQFMIQRVSRLFPFWREPPPDDISFGREELASYTERLFKWSLECRRDLKRTCEDLTLEQLLTSTAPVERVVVFPRDIQVADLFPTAENDTFAWSGQ